MPGARLRETDRQDLVPRVVQRRADQIVHRRIDDDEPLARRIFDIKHTGDEHPGRTRQHPPRLKGEGEIEGREDLADHPRIIGHLGRLFVAVADAKAAAEIDAGDREPARPQRAHQDGQPGEGFAERPEPAGLRADMDG